MTPVSDPTTNIAPPVTTAPVFSVSDYLTPIFENAFLCPATIEVLLGFFWRANDLPRTRAMLRRFLLLDDNGAATMLQPFGTIDVADKLNLKTFRANLKMDFDWKLFTNDFYDSGTSIPNISLPSPPFSEPVLPDAAEFLASDTSPDDAAITASHPDPDPPTKSPPNFFLDIQNLATSNHAKFDAQLPYGTDLQPHPVWQVQASSRALIDTSGFQQVTIPQLRTARPDDVVTWYNQYQQIAFQCGILVIPYSLFRPDCVVYPCTVPAAQVDAMNCAQLVRFGSADVFNDDDPTLHLHHEHFLILHGQETLCVYNFLHALLTDTVTATETSVIPIVPHLANCPDITAFASAMMTFMHRHGTAHQFPPRSATLHFLQELASAGHDVERERNSFLSYDQSAPLPLHLQVNAVAIHIINRISNSAHSHTPRMALAVTRRSQRHPSLPSTPVDSNHFKQPVPDAICPACSRRGHLATSCLLFARYALLTEYYQEHKTLGSKMAKLLTEWHDSSKRHALANLLHATTPTGTSPDLEVDEDDTLPHFLEFFSQDFC